ncbi:hypothetical protein GALL_538600 [mine drainage metagenome]|uniref:Uncharacterized protein n=1 Tax=mine drainage metagenome TaxID=410659 RepID=A0A1J5PAV3_9ZZZZ
MLKRQAQKLDDSTQYYNIQSIHSCWQIWIAWYRIPKMVVAYWKLKPLASIQLDSGKMVCPIPINVRYCIN